MTSAWLVPLVALLVAVAKAQPLPNTNITTYVINLDLAPEQRWLEPVNDYKDDLQALLAFLSDAIPAKYLGLAEKVAGDLDVFLGELGAEIEGISIASGFNLGQITLLNFLYELTAFCTSILAVTPEGVLLHGRNLDYGLPFDLERVTINAQFTRGGVVVFEAVTFVGYVGVLTGKNSYFSVTVDERDKGYSFENAFAAIFEGGKAVTMLNRELLEAGASFETALSALTKTSLIAPCYVIIGGANALQAAIVTRDRYEALNVSYIETIKGEWYEVVTNYDLNVPDPSNDPRRTFAQNHLNAITQAGLSPVTLAAVIATPPVLNNGTIYSIVMSVATGEFTSWVRGPVALE